MLPSEPRAWRMAAEMVSGVLLRLWRKITVGLGGGDDVWGLGHF